MRAGNEILAMAYNQLATINHDTNARRLRERGMNLKHLQTATAN